MFGIGFTEILLIVIIAVIFIEPDKFPGMAKALGKAFIEFRRAGEEIQRSISEDINPPATRAGPAEDRGDEAAGKAKKAPEKAPDVTAQNSAEENAPKDEASHEAAPDGTSKKAT